MPILVRSWNLFHGNTVPPGRVNLLEQAVRLAASGDPDVVCLQEVPVWALEYLDDWTGMIAVGAVTRTMMASVMGPGIHARGPALPTHSRL